MKPKIFQEKTEPLLLALIPPSTGALRSAVNEGDILDTADHPNRARYPGQQIHVITIEDYVYLVPFVESEEQVCLKTIIPSRKATKRYLGVLKKATLCLAPPN